MGGMHRVVLLSAVLWVSACIGADCGLIRNGLAPSHARVLEAVQSLDEAAELAKSVRAELATMQVELDLAQKARERAEVEKHRALKRRHEADSRLTDLSRAEKNEEEKAAAFNKEILTLQTSITSLEAEAKHLTELREQAKLEAKNAGIRHWLERKGKTVLPKTTYGILHKSADLVDPVAGKLHRLQGDPTRPQSFIRSLLTYLLVLAPSVVLLAVVLRIASRVAQLSPDDFVFLGSAFFALQAVLLFALSTCFHVDAMALLQWRHNRHFSVLLLLWAVGYTTYVLYIAKMLHKSRDPNGAFQFMGAVFVGYHFYGEVFRPAVLDEELTIRSSAYLIYATVFGLLAYDSSQHLMSSSEATMNFQGLPLPNSIQALLGLDKSRSNRKSSRRRRKVKANFSV